MLQIIIVQMGFYQHWALLSDRFWGGKPMLISNTMRNGTVREESWDQVVGDKPYKVYQIQTATPASYIIAKARSAINQVKYSLTQYNCEHFVRDVITDTATSKQASKAIIIGGIALGLICLLAKKR